MFPFPAIHAARLLSTLTPRPGSWGRAAVLAASLLVLASRSAAAGAEVPALASPTHAGPFDFRFTNSLTGTELRFHALIPPDGFRHGSGPCSQIFWLPDAAETNRPPGLPPAAVLDAIRRQIIPPAVVIYPDQGAASWFQDSADGRIGDETFFIRQLLPYVDRTLPVKPGRADRFVMGRGTGGFAAFRLAARHPRHFAAAVSIDGAFPTVDDLSTNVVHREFHQRMYDGDFLRLATNHPAHVVQLQAARLRDQTGFLLLRTRAPAALPTPADRIMPEAFRVARVPLELAHAVFPADSPNVLPEPLIQRALEFAFSWSGGARSMDLDGPWVNPPTNPPLRVTHHLIYSRILQRPIGYNLYLPARSNTNSAHATAPLPVLFHLPGRGEHESQHLETIGYLAAAIRVAEVPPAAWVWILAGRAGWYTDGADLRVAAESILVREIIPLVEARWNLGGSRDRRFLDGWGMGAYGAIAIAARHPGDFGAILLHNPDLPDETSFPIRQADAWLSVFANDPHRHAKSDPWALLRILGPRTRDSAPPAFRIRLVAGERSSLRGDADRLHATLDGLGWPHEYQVVPRSGTGGPVLHARTALRDFQFLSQPAAR